MIENSSSIVIENSSSIVIKNSSLIVIEESSLIVIEDWLKTDVSDTNNVCKLAFRDPNVNSLIISFSRSQKKLPLSNTILRVCPEPVGLSTHREVTQLKSTEIWDWSF